MTKNPHVVEKTEFFNRVQNLVDTFKKHNHAEELSFRTSGIKIHIETKHPMFSGPFLIQESNLSECVIDFSPTNGIFDVVIHGKEFHQKILAHPSDITFKDKHLILSHSYLIIKIM